MPDPTMGRRVEAGNPGRPALRSGHDLGGSARKSRKSPRVSTKVWNLFSAAALTLWQARCKQQENTVNWDQIEGNWKQLKGKARQQWGKLTDDEIDQVAGKRDELVGRVQERYGIAREEAERQVKSWEQGI